MTLSLLHAWSRILRTRIVGTGGGVYVHGSILMCDRLLHTIPDDALKRLLNEVGRFRMLYAIVAWSPQLNSSHSSVLMLRQTRDPDGTTHLVWRLYDRNIPFDNMTMEPIFDVQQYVTSFQDLLNNLAHIYNVWHSGTIYSTSGCNSVHGTASKWQYQHSRY